MTPFQSLSEYETFLYSLPERITTSLTSTLVLVRRGAQRAIVGGEVTFTGGCRLVVYEIVNARYGSLRLTDYGYEVWREDEQLYCYDSQPHPNNPNLASTHRHHKHIPPDIKHRRIVAPGLSFTILSFGKPTTSVVGGKKARLLAQRAPRTLIASSTTQIYHVAELTFPNCRNRAPVGRGVTCRVRLTPTRSATPLPDKSAPPDRRAKSL